MGTFDQILSLPPFDRARDFLRVAAEWEEQSGPSLEPTLSGATSIRSHVHGLSSNSQYALLGLPQALMGLGCLAGPLVPQWSIDVAKELANWAMSGPVGEREIDDKEGAWIVEAISLCRHNWRVSVSRFESPTLGTFFQAVASLLRRYPGIGFKEVHGAVFPVLDSLDPVFVDLDARAREIGGMRLLTWVLGPGAKEKELLRDMLLSYACKHIRKEDMRPQALRKTEEPLQVLVEITKQLGRVLRTDSVNDLGERWGLPAFVLEEVARGAVKHALDGRRRDRDADLDFVDHLMRVTADEKTSETWTKARHGLAKRQEGDVFAASASLQPSPWVFNEPPCAEYGRSFKTALRRDLGRQLFISLRKGRVLISPRPGNSELVFEIQERLRLSSAELGAAFEDFINVKLSRFSVLRGVYRPMGQSGQMGDVDALVVRSDGSVAAAFECKAVSEIRDLWFGGNYATLEHFKRSFLKSQEQLLRFEATLMADRKVTLERGDQSDVVSAPDKLLRVSVALRSHGESIHRPGFANALLSHFCGVSLQLTPAPGRSLPRDALATEAELKKLHNRIQDHRKALQQVGVDEDIFTRTLFIDLEILARLADGARSADHLIKILEDAAKYQGIGRVTVAVGASDRAFGRA